MLDPLLRPFVDAVEERDAERELNDLIERHALPLANAIVAHKLRSYNRDASGRSEIQDRQDVVNDALTMLVERLRRARTGEGAAIEDFENYAAMVVYSACAHQIRRRHPERARLKNRLRYVFSTDSRLALWMRNDLVCGLGEWRGRPAEHAAERTLRGLVETDPRDWMSMDRAHFTRAVVDRITQCGGPTDFETFVGALAARVMEPREVADASLAMSSPEPAQDRVLERRRFLEQVWDEVRDLPVRQRVALLLNLRDADGSGILWLLPIAGIATIRQIAFVLEIQDDEFAKLWRELPLDDAAIACRLGCARQQVINLRVSARKRVLNRVTRWLGSAAGRERKRANLVPVSASLKAGA